MLLRFGVQNHGSICEYQEIQLVATTLKDTDSGVVSLSFQKEPDKSLRVLTVAGIYGANAAGKSTLLKALDFFSEGVVSSHVRVAAAKGTPYFPFKLDENSNSLPSHYDADVVLNDVRYHYGYKVDGKKIVSEWLYAFDLNSSRKVRSTLFLRETDDDFLTKFQFGKGLKGENKQISKFVRPNSLFLSAAAQNSHPQLTPLFDFFYKKIVRRLNAEVDSEAISEQLTAYFSQDEKRQKIALDFLKAADVGISSMDFSKIPIDEKTILLLQEFEQVFNKHIDSDEKLSLTDRKEKAKVSLLHSGKNGNSYPIELRYESAGTLSILQLIGPAFVRLQEGGVLVIDELNSTLHPLVSRELIRLFLNPITNPGNAQLIFTTHDTNLLTDQLLRRDQIWFAEKDMEGGTHIYSLSDIKVRNGDNFERGYLSGRFGAIPFIGSNLNDFLECFEFSLSRKNEVN